jgi:hypothetical protein
VGLIQWVHNTVSVYALFRGWQTNMRTRHAAMTAAAAAPPTPQQPGGVAGKPGPISQHHPPALPPILSTSRPTDLFYGHLLPALRAEGLPAMLPRKQWPASVLRKVRQGFVSFLHVVMCTLLVIRPFREGGDSCMLCCIHSSMYIKCWHLQPED